MAVLQHYLVVSANSTVPISEVYTLRTMYDTLDGSSWLWRTDTTSSVWDFNGDIVAVNPCTSNWQGITCECSQSSDACTIVQLNLNAYGLQGALPDMKNLTILNKIDLSDNLIIGNLWSLSNLTMLEYIYLDSTEITGDLWPLSNLTLLNQINFRYTGISGDLWPLSNLTLLNYINCHDTGISGDLWPLSNLTMLEYIYLYKTEITGDLWPLSNLPALQFINFRNTYVSGNLWPLSNLSMLSHITLYENSYITGDLWPLSNLTLLNHINCHDTGISGDLWPLSNLTMLSDISLKFTYISGDLWPLSNLAMLEYVFVGDTYISGDLWPLSNLTMLSDISLNNTRIYGDLWPLSNLAMLEYICLGDTSISGELLSLSDLDLLEYISLYNTRIYGDLWPLERLTKLIFLQLGNCSLSGTLMPLVSLVNLQYCLLDGNTLYGSIPSMNDTSLVWLNVGSNYLTGTLADSTYFPDSLQVLDISNNMLTGMLTNSLFALPRLQIVDASINCMTLDFTSEVCNSSSLESLILDGLHSSSSCITKFPVTFYDTIYTMQYNVVANVPSCLFNLAQLRYLHLSGNGITGLLPVDAELSPSFTELVMGDNELQSIIPSSFQNHHWHTLDLSFNKFTGTLSPNLNVSDSINLKMNRLSGNIPMSLYTTSDVSILTGNIFACTEAQLSKLHDEIGNSYICGSSSFNNISFLWLSMVLTVLGLFMLMHLGYGSKTSPSRISCNRYVSIFVDMIKAKWASISSTASIKKVITMNLVNMPGISVCNIERFADTMSNVRYASSVLTGVIVCVYISLYTLLSNYYGTYYHQYAWTTSAALLSGLNAGIILLVLYVVSLMVGCYYNMPTIVKMPVHIICNKESATTRLSLARRVLSLLNLIVVLVINAFYVAIFLDHGQIVVTFTEIFVSLFKLVWTNYALLFFMQEVEKYIMFSPGPYSHMSWISTISITNNVLMPCLASALIDPDCFYYMIVSPDDIKSTFYTSSTFYLYVNTYLSVIEPVSISSVSQFKPSYTYSYECSSAIIMSYTTIFMYSALFPVIEPFFWTFLEYLNTFKRFMELNKLLVRLFPCFFSDNGAVIDQLSIVHFVLSLIGSIFILITFGVLAPVLGIVTFLSIAAQTLYMEYRVGAYLQHLLKPENTNDGTVCSQVRLDKLQILDNDLKNIDMMILQSLWQALLFIGPFYGLCIFDIVGGEVGYTRALWAPITFILFCSTIYCIPYCVQLRRLILNRDSRHITSSRGSLNRDSRHITSIRGSEVALAESPRTGTTNNPMNSEFS